ncbi:TonB2 energy transduction system inner membrane component ExbB [Thalassotalea insulae]|uniref:TonB2 energy transduction system inner membrane component ExbB n=1 Tax=Thalassotalea insulae TaxID=2056778 RepID=A0ABQ6GYQ2_9GAMM|nr:MotA/TolQ/ExbB proton channel family protein [Thalassotalea insulae]GLX79712.1 TonB2 energy transduction system inner membrane component ExbB [Thalassotalea insulae]
MVVLFELMNSIREFLDTGGQVLTVIAGVICLMWLLIFERLYFFLRGYQQVKKQMINKWYGREERHSWYAEQIRLANVSRITEMLNHNVALIQSLVVLCPLLGLLGTVTGMIEVFDVMAVSGSGNARSMASGVSRATIPTMAGMVGSLSGVFIVTWLQRKTKRRTEQMEDSLPMAH